jgi:hypothetical protein
VSKKQNTLLPFLLESRGGILVKTSWKEQAAQHLI